MLDTKDNPSEINNRKSSKRKKGLNNSYFSSNSSHSVVSDYKELKRRLKYLEKKAKNLQKRNIYYYNMINKNMFMNDLRQYDDPVEEYISLKRGKNLNGFNQLMIDINCKINDFIEDEEKRDKKKLYYYQYINNVNDEIDYKLACMDILGEKERQRDLDRHNICKNYYVLDYNKKNGEINPNTNNYINNYGKDVYRYGNPYDINSFMKNEYMRPGRLNRIGMAINNQFININHPSEFYKYQIFDRFDKNYRTKNNILQQVGSYFVNENNYDRKYKKIRPTSSSDNLYLV